MHYESLDHPPIGEDLNLTFEDCSAGWVNCRLHHWRGGFSETICIRCSHVWDPLPDFIAWLEAIARGADEASWTINEEGWYARVRARRFDEMLELHCEGTPDLDPVATWRERMTLRVQAVGFVSGAYGAFRSFFDSPSFQPTEWCMERLYDQWTHCFTEDRAVPIDRLSARLAGWRRDELLVTLFHAWPSLMDSRPEVPAVPADWDRLDQPARQAALDHLLNESVGGYHGLDPRTMRSEFIESWLAASSRRQ